MSEVDKDFVRFIRNLRQIHGLSQQALADKTIMTRANIQHIENGHQRIYLEQAVKILAVFGYHIQVVKKRRGGASDAR